MFVKHWVRRIIEGIWNYINIHSGLESSVEIEKRVPKNYMYFLEAPHRELSFIRTWCDSVHRVEIRPVIDERLFTKNTRFIPINNNTNLPQHPKYLFRNVYFLFVFLVNFYGSLNMGNKSCKNQDIPQRLSITHFHNLLGCGSATTVVAIEGGVENTGDNFLLFHLLC